MSPTIVGCAEGACFCVVDDSGGVNTFVWVIGIYSECTDDF